jgi:hypothetical protein
VKIKAIDLNHFPGVNKLVVISKINYYVFLFPIASKLAL